MPASPLIRNEALIDTPPRVRVGAAEELDGNLAALQESDCEVCGVGCVLREILVQVEFLVGLPSRRDDGEVLDAFPLEIRGMAMWVVLVSDALSCVTSCSSSAFTRAGSLTSDEWSSQPKALWYFVAA